MRRIVMYKMELLIQSTEDKVDVNNGVGFALEKMKENGIIDSYCQIITAEEPV